MVTGNLSTRAVHVGGVFLDPARSQKLFNHSPDGFAWGYGGSGPAQLALSLLLHFTDDEHWSLNHYQNFKFEVVGSWDQYQNVRLPNKVVTDWIKNNGGTIDAKQNQ